MNNTATSKIRARVIDAAWFRKTVNCMAACPVHTNAQGYIAAIAAGDFDSAYDIARGPNPFVNICARICGHPCETACRRGVHDAPISIRALKRAAVDFAAGGRRSGGTLQRHKRQNKKVAVVGAGPGGVTAAHDLALLGYDVTLFEASDQLGGMLYHGVPEYRLPREVLAAEIDGLLDTGIEVRKNTRIGDQISFSDLRRDYKAVFLAIGAQKGRQLRIDGVEADGVINGIEFLLNVSLGYKVDLGKKVIVVGGGNVAMDVARTAAREAGVEFNSEPSYAVAMDIARSAMHMGAAEVHLVCLESVDEMPAHEDEVLEARKEGVVVHNSLGPTKVIVENGKCQGLRVIKVASVFDENGRFAPKFIDGSEMDISCDSILLAVGQQPELGFLGEENKLDLTPSGFVKAKKDTMETNIPGVYVGGDVCFGARTAIEAIADARRAASAIHTFLSGQTLDEEVVAKPRLTPLPMHKMPDLYDRIPREEVPTLPIDRRTGVTEVEVGYTRDQAMHEASRCLTCNKSPVLDSSKCVLCGGCVDICPFGCIKFVSVGRLDGDTRVENLAQLRHGTSIEDMANQSPDSGDRWFAMVKDEEKCTRCALCVERCPVGALWMGEFQEVADARV